MKPTSFSIALGQQRPKLHKEPCTFEDAQCSLWVNKSNDYHIQYRLEATGFMLFIGERSSQPFHTHEMTHLPAQGTLIRYDSESRQFQLTCDRLGTAIVFYRTLSNGTVCFSNRLEHLVIKETTIDWHSIQQYLCRGYTLNNKTFFQEVQQTQPNQDTKVSLEEPSPRLSITERKRFTPVNGHPPIETVAERLKEHLKNSSHGILMMSAGWDSRTLLLNGRDPFVTAYSHGDLSSRELRIAQRLTGSERLDHLFTEISRLDFGPELLENMLEENGFCVFPIWYLAAKKLSKLYDAPLVSGVLGELLGGHYGLLSLGNRWQKLKSALFIFNKQTIPEHRIEAAVKKFAAPPTSHWFLTRDANEHFSSLANATAIATFDAMNQRYKTSGDWQLAIEQFNMDHRARQYILKQAQAASGILGYCLPFADERAVDATRQIPFADRVHNKANQHILQHYRPQLLSEPMSATLVGAKYPVPVQEFSRGLRIARELISKRFSKKGPQLGWFNYEHLYQRSTLNDIIESLNDEIWDKERMRSTIIMNPQNGIDAGSTLDMLCKIKFIDYIIN